MSVVLEKKLFYKVSSPKLESTRSILKRVQQKRALHLKSNCPAAAMPSSTRSTSKKNTSVSHRIQKRKIETGTEQNGKQTAGPMQKKCKLEPVKKENVDHLGPMNLQNVVQCAKVEEPSSDSSTNCGTSENESLSTSSSPTTIKTPPSSPLSLPRLDVSEYEMKIQENIQQRMQFLSSLNIEETKNDALKLCTVPKSPATQDRGIAKIKKKSSPRSPVARRKSLRLSQKPPETTPKYSPPPENVEPEFIRPETGGALIDYLNEKLNKDEGSKMLEHTRDVARRATPQPPSWAGDLPKVLSRMSKLDLREDTLAKTVPGRIMSMAFHPSATDDILFSGDKSGHLGMWHVDRKDEVDGTWCFRIHGAGINCLSLDAGCSSRVITTSYDGSTRATDLEKLVVDEVFSLECESHRHYLTWHTQLSPHVLLISSGSGTVTRVDMREEATVSKVLDQKRSIKVVAGHPVASHYFVSSSAKGEVVLWDLRHLKNASSSICSFSHPNTASAVRFSPVTGNTLLTTSSDDKIRLLSLKNFSSFEQKRSIRHFNQTGRWLTTLKADFLPGREDAFIVGSLDRRRVIEVWETQDKISPVLLDGELMTTYTSTVCCHPSRFVVAGGNSSGKCYVFR